MIVVDASGLIKAVVLVVGVLMILGLPYVLAELPYVLAELVFDGTAVVNSVLQTVSVSSV